ATDRPDDTTRQRRIARGRAIQTTASCRNPDTPGRSFAAANKAPAAGLARMVARLAVNRGWTSPRPTTGRRSKRQTRLNEIGRTAAELWAAIGSSRLRLSRRRSRPSGRRAGRCWPTHGRQRRFRPLVIHRRRLGLLHLDAASGRFLLEVVELTANLSG